MISLKTIVLVVMVLCIIVSIIAAYMFLDAIEADDTFAAWVNSIFAVAMAGCAILNYRSYIRF